MSFLTFIKNIKPESIPACLSCIACIWLITKLLIKKKRSIGIFLILVLAVSDFIFALNDILSYFFPSFFILEANNVYDFVYFSSMYFSIWWASAISFLVYKSLRDKDFDSKSPFLKMLIPILILSCSTGAYWHYYPAEEQYCIPLLLPLVLSFLLTIAFYEKSIKLLREHSDAEVQSTRIYIRTLRFYSVVQLLTYGPLILSLIVPVADQKKIVVLNYIDLARLVEAIANLSGLFTALIFASQAAVTSHRPIVEQIDDNDLTRDFV